MSLLKTHPNIRITTGFDGPVAFSHGMRRRLSRHKDAPFKEKYLS
jgi:hypothetical protein